MSLANYGALKTSIAAWATRTDLTATIPDFVTWAHEEISRRLRANVLLGSADVAVTGETAAQPADFLGVKSFYLDVTPRLFLSVIGSASVQERIAAYSTGTYPDCVAIEGSNFHFAPLYSTATTGKLSYYKAPVTLAADGDTNVVLAKYPYLYLYGALEALFRYLEDDNNADRYGQLFGGLIESVNAEEAKDAMRGPVRPMPAGGSVV